MAITIEIPLKSPPVLSQVAKGLVQIEVAHIRPDDARGGEPQLGVHVGAVHVDLTAVLVHDVAGPGERTWKSQGETGIYGIYGIYGKTNIMFIVV